METTTREINLFVCCSESTQTSFWAVRPYQIQWWWATPTLRLRLISWKGVRKTVTLSSSPQEEEEKEEEEEETYNNSRGGGVQNDLSAVKFQTFNLEWNVRADSHTHCSRVSEVSRDLLLAAQAILPLGDTHCSGANLPSDWWLMGFAVLYRCWTQPLSST